MDVQIKHKGTIINGKKVYDFPKVHQARLDSLEGKRFEETLEAEHEKVTKYQWGYYFGGIIKGTCMNSEIFNGWTFNEIKKGLLTSLRTTDKVVIFPNGNEKIMKYTDDLKQYSKSEMVKYIDDVLNFLAELEIHPLPPDYYKYGVNMQIKKQIDGKT